VRDEYDFSAAWPMPEDLRLLMERNAYEECVRRFIEESNRIEGWRDGAWDERQQDVMLRFLATRPLTIHDLWSIARVAPGVESTMQIRAEPGLNVVITGRRRDEVVVLHEPPPGGPEVLRRLEAVVQAVNTGEEAPHYEWSVYEMHVAFETLHPFTDGNGRAGRALWLWMMLRYNIDPGALVRGFLHTWYYQSLRADRRK
jgi:hypothetical protein